MSTGLDMYLRGAEEAGLLGRFAGSPYVAGSYEEPVRGELQYLVTYVDPDLAASCAWWAELPGIARTADPATRAVVARVPSDHRPPTPWHRYLTYLSYHGAAAVPAEAGDHAPDLPEVVPARPEHEGLIVAWLGVALSNAALCHGAEDARPQEDVLKSLLDHPGRASFVVLLDGAPAGHATVFCDERDDVTGEPIAELFDILVEAPPADRRRATMALVSAAARHAGARRLPLIGNVVHTLTGEVDPGERVVAALRSQGWRPDHVMWWLALDEPTRAAGTSAHREDTGR
ncbi:hypothetical protein [Streptomyces iranensis]|uniref:Uncharacterized protein n=1 Tax=Streptomyces iranensis TaxID=576784 RepID=A0A060ZWF8_9ACTN|nr:hypothetical protein [Streptomyces iranensis]MBP2059529.1 hypothetical protein [Streptomyces iranensis]CDR10629.1 predicted protein [Streptomyces iranensis]